MTQQKQNKQNGFGVLGGDVVGYGKRGRPSRSGDVCIEPIHVRECNLTKLAQVLEQYARYMDANVSEAQARQCGCVAQYHGQCAATWRSMPIVSPIVPLVGFANKTPRCQRYRNRVTVTLFEGNISTSRAGAE